MMTARSWPTREEWRKILIVWAVVAAAAACTVAALRLYSIALIDWIQKSDRNPAIVAGSFQREAERHQARALEKVEARRKAGRPPLLPGDDPDVNEAIRLFEKSYELQPYNADLLAAISDLYGLIGDEAQQLYYQGRFYLSWQSDQRRPQAALELFERAAAAAPGRTEIELGVAEALLDLGRLEEAGRSIQAVLERADPPPPEALFLMGRIRERQGELKEAISWLERAVERRPDYAVAVKQLAVYYEAAGQAEKAVALFEASKKLLPWDANLLHLLGKLYIRTNRLDEGIKNLKAAYRINPRSLPLLEDLIRALGRKGDREAVRFYTNKAIELDPDFVLRRLENQAAKP
ncbi:MAG: hypothetical protein Kow0059_18820 [Candidatus Sumerlaeia bacterium]